MHWTRRKETRTVVVSKRTGWKLERRNGCKSSPPSCILSFLTEVELGRAMKEAGFSDAIFIPDRIIRNGYTYLPQPHTRGEPIEN